MDLPSLRSSFIYPLSQSRPHISNPKRRLIITSSSSSSDEDPHKNRLHLLHLSVTLTVLSPSLPALADKKHRSSKKPAEKSHLTPDELRSWSSNLPTVSTRIPYTDLLSLKRRNFLKHIVKLPSSALKNRPDPVLVVLQDSTVLRTVLPTVERDSKFWEEWDELNLNSVCINAYSPPVTKPQIPAPYLGWAAQGLNLLVKLLKRKPKSKRVLEIEQARRELAEERRSEMARLREEREALDRNLRRQKKAEERRKKLETRKVRYEQSLRQARRNYKDMASKWASLARDQNVATVMGFLIFFVFYRTVVLSYRKQKRDYEDRLKIEKADAEERKRMRELEKEMIGLEGSDDEEDGVEGKEEDENAYLKMAKQFMQSGARVRRAHNKRLPQYMERGNEVKFRDVAGLGNIRLELEEIVKFFTLGEMYRRRGVKIPGGILLCGPPGVGKTLLAKAVAGEAGVNFFSISASQFVEIYVGVGASRVRALYQEARENAPSVVFIDEIDAVGRERGLIKGSGGQERDATLNQLLVCLDGFEGRGNVITIAATNRPDILDPALVRPGRFDRKIFIPKPSLIGRVEILKVHGEKKPMADNVDYAAVASMTEGMVGAELANVIEIAAISMMREGRSEITTDDLLQAVQIEEIGMLDKKDRSEELWKRVALNEAAMAVVAVNFPDTKNIEFVTVAPRAGRELGYVRVKMEEMKFQEGMLSRQSLLDHITVQIAPRAADEIWFGEDQLSTIWAETANNARSAARTFVLGGLSEKNYGLSDFWVADRIKDIDLEALDVLNNCYERAKVILQRNSGLIDALVDQLVQKRSLAKKDFLNLVEEKGNLDPMPQSVIAIRNAKRQQFQEMMMARNQLEKGHLH